MPGDCTDYIISTHNTLHNENIKLQLKIQSLYINNKQLKNTNHNLNNLLTYSYYNSCIILSICILLFCIIDEIYIHNIIIDKDCYIFIYYLYYIFILLGIIQITSIIFYFLSSKK